MKQHRFGLTLLSRDDRKYRVAAEAIYHVGRDRLSDLLSLDMPDQLLAQLMGTVANARFKGLGESLIMALLRSEDQDVRKAASLKCVCVFSRERLKKLLHDYVSGDDQYYYNVLFWLDFGMATPRDRAIASAGRELKRILYVPELR